MLGPACPGDPLAARIRLRSASKFRGSRTARGDSREFGWSVLAGAKRVAPDLREHGGVLEEIMADPASDGADDYNTKIVEEFRANQGRVGGPWAGTTLILIHHIGARSGVERVVPLGCFPQGDGRFAIVASSGGSPAHPAWYHNLKASPRITVEVGGQTFTALAEELNDPARAELWPKLVSRYPAVGEHQAKTGRQIPVFMLTRQN